MLKQVVGDPLEKASLQAGRDFYYKGLKNLRVYGLTFGNVGG